MRQIHPTLTPLKCVEFDLSEAEVCGESQLQHRDETTGRIDAVTWGDAPSGIACFAMPAPCAHQKGCAGVRTSLLCTTRRTGRDCSSPLLGLSRRSATTILWRRVTTRLPSCRPVITEGTPWVTQAYRPGLDVASSSRLSHLPQRLWLHRNAGILAVVPQHSTWRTIMA
jgi:hypothetical protein